MRGRPRRDTGGLTYDQWYYQEKRKHRPRPSRRIDPSAICLFCEVRLLSRFGSRYGRKYCDDCRTSPRVQRYLQQVYQRRKYTGKPVRITSKSL